MFDYITSQTSGENVYIFIYIPSDSRSTHSALDGTTESAFQPILLMNMGRPCRTTEPSLI